MCFGVKGYTTTLIATSTLFIVVLGRFSTQSSQSMKFLIIKWIVVLDSMHDSFELTRPLALRKLHNACVKTLRRGAHQDSGKQACQPYHFRVCKISTRLHPLLLTVSNCTLVCDNFQYSCGTKN